MGATAVISFRSFYLHTRLHSSRVTTVFLYELLLEKVNRNRLKIEETFLLGGVPNALTIKKLKK